MAGSFRPVTTAVFIVQALAILWLVGASSTSCRACSAASAGHWRLVGGVVAIVAGLLLIGNPFVGAFLVVTLQFYVIALAATVDGVINIVGRLQGLHGWRRLVLGIVQLALGVFLLFNSQTGLVVLVPAVGIVVASEAPSSWWRRS